MPFILKKTITETFHDRVKLTPDSIGFQFKPTYPEEGLIGTWKQVTFRQFYDECRLISLGLVGLGIQRGDKVAILSNTRFEWSLCDMAILGAGAVVVPIYASNLADDVAYILNHSEARAVILEDAKQIEKVLTHWNEKPDSLKKLEKIIVIDPTAMRLAAVRKDILTLQALKEIGKREEVQNSGLFDKNLLQAQPEDLITICYTSGTTGIPKGAMITHDNMMSVLEDCFSVLSKYVQPEREVILSFLPFSHILGKVESMAISVFGWRQCFAENLDQLMTNIGEVRPTLLFAVPRIFEKAHSRINAMGEASPKVKRKLFHWALEVGHRYYSTIWAKKSPSLKDLAEYTAAKALVLNKITARFGGKLRFAVCGGAPLPREIGEYFQIVGIKILEGYGLTETCAPVSINSPDDPRFGAVGRPLPEVAIKIAEDGEVLVKSRKVFKGYYKMPEETSEVLKNGWFYTGDIGYLDADGFLRITDRKKDIIVTSGGKNIAPQKIENLAKTYEYISQFVVHGDRRNYLTALLTLERDQVIRYASENQILFSEYPELVKHPKIQSLVQKIIDDMNTQLPSFEKIKKFLVLSHDFTVESGELTPSLKVRRRFINKRFQSELDSMYTP